MALRRTASGRWAEPIPLARRPATRTNVHQRVCRWPQLFGSSATRAFLAQVSNLGYGITVSQLLPVATLGVPRIGRSRELNFGLKV